jgi:peptidoglycan/xylan/chitin deacetylase (PgdA/CDA1 family)
MINETTVTVASVAGAAGLAAWAVRGRSSTLLARSYWEGTRTRPSIALTFDDGPSESTPDLLEELERWNVRATFFQCGANVRRLPEIAAMVLECGHEIGNHSDLHPHFQFRSRKFIQADLAAAQRTFQEVLNYKPKLFRPPFGIRWFGMGAAQKKLGLTGVMWSCIGLDWRLGSSAIAARCLDAARSGAIYCLHDGRELQVRPNVRPSIEAAKRIIPELIDRGYEFETVSELLSPNPPAAAVEPAT